MTRKNCEVKFIPRNLSITECQFDCVTSLVVFILNPSYNFLQADKKALEETEAELKKEMTSLKERNHSLEQMLNELLSKGNSVLIYLFVCFG